MKEHPHASASRRDRALAAAAQERELTLAREAIAMVASGASPRVVVAGIRYGDEIMDSARRTALAFGVRVKPLPQPGNAGLDLAVEPIYE